MTAGRSPSAPRSRRARRDSGAVMVQFALFAFGFFALAAVVIDVRIATMTQQRMQDATDYAVLEGMRNRDRYNDFNRREVTQRAVEVFFDDDHDYTNRDLTGVGMGAGPLISLSGGQPESNALAKLDIDPANRFYFPTPQSNRTNQPHGDIVAGDYNDAATVHEEFGDYSRSDFTPSASGNNVGTLSSQQPNLLVRLRRTNDLLGLDNVNGVSQSAPPIPFLFGLGSMIHRTPGSGYNPRTDGMTVRSASIAGTRRAVSVSSPGPSRGFRPMQRFMFMAPNPFTLWDTWDAGQQRTFTVNALGHLSSGGVEWGRFGRPSGQPSGVLTKVGELVDSNPMTTIHNGESFVPITLPVPGDWVVIGFGRIRVDQVVTTVAPPTTTITITKLRGIVEHGGATATDPEPMASLAASALVQDRHRSFTEPVLAPVLTR